MAPATKRKNPADATDSKDIPSTKPVKKRRSAPKKSVLVKGELWRKHPALKTALRTLSWERSKSHYTLATLLDNQNGLLEREEDTESGTIKLQDNVYWPKFWEATARAAVLEGHEDAPKVKLDDFVDVLKEPKIYDGENQMHITFTATVIESGRHEGLDSIRILPCGWPWVDAMNKGVSLVLEGKQDASDDDLKDMVDKTSRFSGAYGVDPSSNKWSGYLDKLQDPQPVSQAKVGRVTKVDGEEVELHVAQELARQTELQGLKHWEKDVTVRLVEGIEKPDIGTLCVFKGLLEPFTKEVRDGKFIAEVCEKMEEVSS